MLNMFNWVERRWGNIEKENGREITIFHSFGWREKGKEGNEMGGDFPSGPANAILLNWKENLKKKFLSHVIDYFVPLITIISYVI